MAGSTALSKLQFGRESSAGTAVAATTQWRGMGAITDARELVFVEENVGYIAGLSRTYIPKLEATIALDEIEATFEQLPHILEMGVKTATPAQDGTGSGYIYTYTFPTTTQNTIKTYTIEGGDDQQAEEVEYCHCTAFTLTGTAGEAWKMSAEITGRQATNTTFTGALTPPTVETMLFSKTKLYIDDTGGTIGSTQATNTLLSAELSVETGQKAVYTAEGNLYFSFVKNIRPTYSLSITFEHDSTSVTEKTNWRNETAQLIRLKCEGSAISDTTGATYTVKTMHIDLAGRWETFEPLSDEDGNNTITATFQGGYIADDTTFGQILIVNELSSLP